MLALLSLAACAAAQLTELPSEYTSEDPELFGFALSLDGDRAAVGAAEDRVRGGFVEIHERDESTREWVKVAELRPDASDYDFGRSVSLDGDRVLAGGRRGGYVFDLVDGEWALTARLDTGLVFDILNRDMSVALAGDRALLGIWQGGYDEQSDTSTGSALFFVRTAEGAWEKEHEAVGKNLRDRFGWAVDLQGDRAAVSAYSEFVDDMFSGAVYVLLRNPETGAWDEEAKLVPEIESGRSGYSASLDGDRVLIGAIQGLSDPGAAFVYARDPETGVWAQEAEFRAPDGQNDDAFGYDVALSGTRALVGQYSQRCSNPFYCDTDGRRPGKVHAYQLVDGAWEPEAVLLTGERNFNDFDNFGASVALDETRGLIAAPNGGRWYTVKFPIAGFSQSCTLRLTVTGVPGASMIVYAGASAPAESIPFEHEDGCRVRPDILAVTSWRVELDEAGQYELAEQYPQQVCSRVLVQVLDLQTCALSDPMAAAA